MRNAIIVSFAAVLGACTPPAEHPDGEARCTVETGKPACEVEGEHLFGDEPASLASGRGQIILVDFWATTCRPCKSSFPRYQKIVDRHDGKFAVIAVSTDSPEVADAEEVKKFASDLGVSFAIVWDREGTTARLYDPPAMPTSYLIDQQGILRHIHEGFRSGDAERLGEEIEAMMD